MFFFDSCYNSSFFVLNFNRMTSLNLKTIDFFYYTIMKNKNSVFTNLFDETLFLTQLNKKVFNILLISD